MLHVIQKMLQCLIFTTLSHLRCMSTMETGETSSPVSTQERFAREIGLTTFLAGGNTKVI